LRPASENTRHTHHQRRPQHRRNQSNNSHFRSAFHSMDLDR
jgi:hypothetical protein